MKLRERKAAFKAELEAVKSNLPHNYGVLFKILYPDADVKLLYSVCNNRKIDYKILEKLQNINNTLIIRDKGNPLVAA